jgi:FkbM family methyltransferase
MLPRSVTTGPDSHVSAATATRDHLADELRFVMRGQSLGDRWQIARMLVHLHTRVGRIRSLTKRLPKRRVREFDLQLREGPSLRIRNDDVVLAFIFGVGEYDVDLAPLGEVKTLLDLGGNVGLASLYLNERLGLERVAAVEPSKANFRLLEENFQRNLPQATALRAAVVGEAGDYAVEEDAFPGEIKVVPGEGSVKALTLPEVLDHFELDTVDLMKIDIEGGEAGIFERAGDWAGRVGAILGEVHPPLTVEAAHAQLGEFGFEPLPLPDRHFFGDIIYMHKP